MEPVKAPREKTEWGYGRRKGALGAWVGDRLHWSPGAHLKEGRKKDEVEDFEPRAKDPRFSTRSHRTTWTASVATPFFSPGRRPTSRTRPNSARRNGIHSVPPWISAPLPFPQSRKVRRRIVLRHQRTSPIEFHQPFRAYQITTIRPRTTGTRHGLNPHRALD